jgi:hypothetical protein
MMRPSVVGQQPKPKPKENTSAAGNPIGGIQGTPINVKEQIKSAPKYSVSNPATSARASSSKGGSATQEKTTQQPRQSKQSSSLTASTGPGQHRPTSQSRLSNQSNNKKKGVVAEKNPNDSSILDLHKRTLMNSDIMDELELTDDIRFDKDLKVQRENKAARTIQRWYKSKMQDRMMREAEKAISETRQLLKLKKERLLKNYA